MRLHTHTHRPFDTTDRPLRPISDTTDLDTTMVIMDIVRELRALATGSRYAHRGRSRFSKHLRMYT